MKKVLTILTVLVIAQVGLSSEVASVWLGVSGGYYHDPTLWDNGVPDQSNSQACYLYNMDGTGPSVIANGENYSISSLNIGDWSNSNGLAWVEVQTGGSVTTSWRVWVSYSGSLAYQGAGAAIGKLDITGGSVSGLTIIGGNNDAVVNISNGGSLAGWWIGIGGEISSSPNPNSSGMPGNGVVNITGGYMKVDGGSSNLLTIYNGSVINIGGDGQLLWTGNHITTDPNAGDNVINEYIAAGKIQALDGYTLQTQFDSNQWATVVSAVPVPEPLTSLLLSLGFAGLLRRRS